MKQAIFVGLLLLVFIETVDSSGSRQSDSEVVIDVQSDPTQARRLDRWPNDEDLGRLRSVEGKPKEVILRVLGHPSRVERRPDGEEIWDYPWCAACCVWVRNGVCTETFYIGGY